MSKRSKILDDHIKIVQGSCWEWHDSSNRSAVYWFQQNLQFIISPTVCIFFEKVNVFTGQSFQTGNGVRPCRGDWPCAIYP